MSDWHELDLESPDDPGLLDRLQAALESARILLRQELPDGALLVVTKMRLQDSDLPNRLLSVFHLYWVDWIGSAHDEWPPDEDDCVFGRMEDGKRRRQSWLYNSASEAARIVRELWGIELAVPPDLN